MNMKLSVAEVWLQKLPKLVFTVARSVTNKDLAVVLRRILIRSECYGDLPQEFVHGLMQILCLKHQRLFQRHMGLS